MTRREPSVQQSMPRAGTSSGDSDADTALRQRFAELRAVRAAQAGQFDAMLAATASHGPAAATAPLPLAPRSWPRRRFVLAAAAALPLIAMLGLHVRERVQIRADVALAREVSALVNWQSPTDALLPASHAQDLMTPRALTESIIPMPPSPGGVQ